MQTDGVEVARIFSSWRRVYQTCQDDVSDFLPDVVNFVFKYAAEDVKLKDWETDSDDDIEYNDRDIAVNASRVEEKNGAINLIYALGKYSHGAFTPFVEKAAQVLIPIIAKPDDDSVLEAAAEALPGLLICLSDAKKSERHSTPQIP